MNRNEAVKHVEKMASPVLTWDGMPAGERRRRLWGRSVHVEPPGWTVEALADGVGILVQGTAVRVPVTLGRPFRVGGGKAVDGSRAGSGWWGVEATTREGGRGMLCWHPESRTASGVVRLAGGATDGR